MISLPVSFDVATFVANNVTLGMALVGIGMVFFIVRLIQKLIYMAKTSL